ncbi:MAG: nucleoside recognition protein [Lachnospiraceae bacterium]|nr:nucleoside recognition protein [Lachnospiraceae bacterium]
MLNFIWAGMIMIGIFYAVIRGDVAVITDAALDSAKEAVTLCITMIGVMSFWSGIMEIATKAGVVEMLSKVLRPAIQFMFPRIPRRHKANEYITTNVIANILGLGWAATPAGLQAMEALSELQEERGEERSVASNEMCTFLILNISSLQLIPMNMIAYRSQYGSVNPARIVGPGLVATMISTLVGCIYCKWKDRKCGR